LERLLYKANAQEKKYFAERQRLAKEANSKLGLISVQFGGIKIHSIRGCFVPTLKHRMQNN
jgi:hypothetical protein